MDRPSSRYSVRDWDNTIAYLKSEHSKTLEGLHEQIEQLQRKCAGLTFELAMKQTYEPIRSELSQEIKTDNTQLERELGEARSALLVERANVANRDEQINQLRISLRQTQQSLCEEVRLKEEAAQGLHTKADLVANLMTQLHKEKQKNRKLVDQLKEYGDTTHHQQSALGRRVVGSAKITKIKQSNLQKSVPPVLADAHSSASTSPLRHLPRPPTTPPPDKQHVRRASTPGQNSSPLPQGQGRPTSGRRLVLSEPSKHTSSHKTPLNPLKHNTSLEALGYKDIKEEEEQVRATTPRQQLSILPPIVPFQGDNTLSGDEESSKESDILKQQQFPTKRPAAHLKTLDSQVGVNSPEQAWMRQLSPPRDSK